MIRIQETVDTCIQMVTRDIQVSLTQEWANCLTGGPQWNLEFYRETYMSEVYGENICGFDAS